MPPHDPDPAGATDQAAVNPYAVRSDTPVDARSAAGRAVDALDINFAIGTRGTLAVCGLATVFQTAGLVGLPNAGFLVAALIHLGLPAALAGSLPGTPEWKVGRGVVAGLLSLAAVILYVPACFVGIPVAVASDAIGINPFGVVAYCMAVEASVMFLVAWQVRKTARNRIAAERHHLSDQNDEP